MQPVPYEVIRFLQAREILSSIWIDIKHPVLFFNTNENIPDLRLWWLNFLSEREKVILALGEIFMIAAGAND